MKYLLAIWIVLTGISCSKTGSSGDDSIPPVITLNTPLNNQVFTAGQPIHISGSVSDNNYIAEVHIHVSNITSGGLLMDVHLYPAGPAATFNQSITAAAGIDYRIQVIAKDRSLNEARSSVDVSCN